MSAYLVIEATVRDREALDRYASQAIPLIRQFGGACGEGYAPKPQTVN